MLKENEGCRSLTIHCRLLTQPRLFLFTTLFLCLWQLCIEMKKAFFITDRWTIFWSWKDQFNYTRMVKLIKELNSDVYEDWIRLIISMSDPN